MFGLKLTAQGHPLRQGGVAYIGRDCQNLAVPGVVHVDCQNLICEVGAAF